ncbi:MAG: protein translocase subunit SecF [Phycisphaerae bacterium]|nr:protein translocase subunit SecF [Phycisphaerae bacterium]
MTLGFGVVTSMFTALVVTRLIFSSMVSAGWLKSLPMLRLIGHPKINWLQLRTFFWPVSVVLTITGIVAFGTATATDKEALYDIEFLGGTSVQIETLPDVTLTDEQVTQLVTDKSGTSVVTWLLEAADALESAQVEAGTVPGEFVLTTSDRLTGDQMAVLVRASGELETRLARDGVQTEGNQATFITRIREVETKTAASEEETPAEEKAPAVQVMTQDEFREAVRKAAAYARKTADDRLSVARVQYAQVAGEETGTPHAFDIVTVETSRELVQTAIVAVMGDKLRIELPIEAKLVTDPDKAPDGYFPIAAGVRYLSDVVPGNWQFEIQQYRGGVVLVFDGIRPAQTTTAIANRIREIRLQPEYEGYAYREYMVFGLDDAPGAGTDAEKKYTKVALAVMDENIYYDPSNPDPWREGLAVPEREQAEAAFASEKTLRQVLQFDGQVAKRTQTQATVAMILACGAIVAYVWIRFGTMQYGLAAIIALVHDVSITLGLVTLADLVGLRNFRIDLAMIAALLTIIGYSLNDTIVIFDRIRENRGKLAHLSTEMINASINQCMSRTLLTSGTTLIVVLIMFLWGGPGVHGFSFALLIGVIVGTYSSVAIAAPLLASPRVLAAIVYGLIGLTVFGVVAQVLSTNVARGIAGLVVAVATVLIVLWDYRSRYGIVPGTRPA